MASLYIDSFEDIDSTLTANTGYYEWSIDLGEAGEHEIMLDVDYIMDSDCISPETNGVTVDTEQLGKDIVNQDVLQEVIEGLIEASSIEHVFETIVSIAPDYEDE